MRNIYFMKTEMHHQDINAVTMSARDGTFSALSGVCASHHMKNCQDKLI